MDIVSHGLWATALYKGLNQRKNKPADSKPFRLRLAAFWGVFPDLFAFSIPFAWLIWNVIFGDLSFSQFGPIDAHESSRFAVLPVAHIATTLYNYSHSLVLFIAVFGLVSFFMRKSRIPWEMGGWLLHIFIDVPTHSDRFYPTPVFWPISKLEFSGFSWFTPWFMALNISALIIVFWFLRRRKKA